MRQQSIDWQSEVDTFRKLEFSFSDVSNDNDIRETSDSFSSDVYLGNKVDALNESLSETTEKTEKTEKTDVTVTDHTTEENVKETSSHQSDSIHSPLIQ